MVSGEKRNCEEENVLERITNILLDIEGTTSSISFVKDVLFPYVRENLKSYINDHWNEEELKADIKALKAQAKKDEEEKLKNFCPIEEGEKEKETLISNVLWQMDLDRKTTALKQLQGHIWREGYENGKIKGQVYDDVEQMLKKWSQDGKKLYIYSSGSVEAQKLLFKYSEKGDLSGFLSGYFDTEIGPKTEASSYTNIVNKMECEAGQVLFLTDVIKEAVAADKAGLQVIIIVREGNTPLADDEKKAFSTVTSFKDIALESSNKKKKLCEEEKSVNEERTEESSDIKNGNAEKMETESTEHKPDDCNVENKTEENGATKMESEETSETPETKSEDGDVNVDDSITEKSEEKVPTVSANEVQDEKSTVSEDTEKPSEDSKKEELNTTETSLNVCDDETEKNPAQEEGSLEGDDNKIEKSLNGHENGEAKENKEEKEKEANGKVEEEEMEAVPVKKISGEEQADSTVEVTA